MVNEVGDEEALGLSQQARCPVGQAWPAGFGQLSGAGESKPGCSLGQGRA